MTTVRGRNLEVKGFFSAEQANRFITRICKPLVPGDHFMILDQN